MGEKNLGKGRAIPGQDGPRQGLALGSAQHRVERAAGEFRRGMPVYPHGQGIGAALLACAAETLTDANLVALGKISLAPPLLVLTHDRATTLKIPLYTAGVVGVRLKPELKAAQICAIADPTTDLAHPLKGPFDAVRDGLPNAAAASIKLAKLAGLLPATVFFTLDDNTVRALLRDGVVLQISPADILAFDRDMARDLAIVTRARVPLDGAESCELVAFRPGDGGPEHHAILIGVAGSAGLAPPGPVLTRLHSECFTGDLLGSLRCDCGDQLRGAVRAIAAGGGGMLIYLAQEGRGVGLMNKLRAYRLQDEGFDTMEANRRLGFAADERLYDIAARILELLGYDSVRLMTNNPDKIRALEAAGIRVSERVPHSFPDNVHSRDYMRTKAERGGHLL